MSTEYHRVQTSSDGQLLVNGINKSFYKNQNASKRSIPDIALIDDVDQPQEGQVRKAEFMIHVYII